jgi:hypothetical protein
MRTSHAVARTAAAILACVLAVPGTALAVDIKFRNFSPSAAIGPPADAYAAKLSDYTATVLGSANAVNFLRLPGTPGIPSAFGGDIVKAVAAGGTLAQTLGAPGGGFDAAYSSGSELNKTWGFIYNSGVPFGPSFEEHLGFLYGKSIDGQTTGLELIQSIYDARGRNVVALPIVGSAEQLSGYFPLPIGNVPGMQGIGLEGFCQQPWTLRYLPPAENVLGYACDALVASGAIPAKNIKFIAAIPGGGSLTQAVNLGQLQGFEFATPLDDKSQLFGSCTTPPSTVPFPCNPGTVGVRYVHFPGWQQQFLITWMIINRQVWDSLSDAQRVMVYTVARDHVISSYGENMRQQGPAMRFILDANQGDGDPSNDMVFTLWPKKAQQQLRDATVQFLNDRFYDPSLPQADRDDYKTVLEAYRKYVLANDVYWDDRAVESRMRFADWQNEDGQPWQLGTHK